MNVILFLVTIFSLALAAAMGAMLWLNTREQQRRSAARVAALEADIYNVAPGPVISEVVPGRPRQSVVIVAAGLSVFAVIGLLVAAIGGFGATAAGARERTQASAPAQPVQAPAPAQAIPHQPLELMALTHEREGDRLTVHGVVRNPANGGTVADLTAVVLVFDRSGSFVASGNTGIAPSLASGGESSFSVTVPNIADVGRYRVSFKSGNNVIPHVDRRG